MTNQQLYLAIGIPSILVILSWITGFLQNNRLDTKIDGLRTEMFHEFKEFYRTLGQHDGQIEVLKREGK